MAIAMPVEQQESQSVLGSPAGGGVKMGPRQGPSWLPEFLSAHFFTPCPIHAPGSHYMHKTDRNKFCLDCKGDGLCALCIGEGTHNRHEVLQVRRASHHDAVRVSDVHNMLDLTDIQRYTINNASIVFVNGRPPPQPFKGGYQFCEVCGRLLLDDIYRLCSIGCKLTAICGAVKDANFTLSPGPQQVVAQGLEDRPEARKALQRKVRAEKTKPEKAERQAKKVKRRDKLRPAPRGLELVKGDGYKDVRLRRALKKLLPMLGCDLSVDQLKGCELLLKRPLQVSAGSDSGPTTDSENAVPVKKQRVLPRLDDEWTSTDFSGSYASGTRSLGSPTRDSESLEDLSASDVDKEKTWMPLLDREPCAPSAF